MTSLEKKIKIPNFSQILTPPPPKMDAICI